MAYLTSEFFTFESKAFPPDTFGVIRFAGNEGLSQCYEFDIDLVSEEKALDLGEMLKKNAVFTIKRQNGENIPFHGILAQFEQRQEYQGFAFYRAVLVPRLWWLSLTHHNQVFLDKTVPEILGEVLGDGGLSPLDYSLRLQDNYPRWEYVCQYRESHFQFFSRWMERDGLYYYFSQTPEGEKVMITDTHLAHSAMPQGQTMVYAPPSGLDSERMDEVIQAFVCRQRMLPKDLLLRDFNYERPALEIAGQAQVKSDGRGQIYIYGEHFRTSEEGKALAEIRAQEYLCQEKEFTGESFIPYLRPGYTFTLKDHYRSDSNQTYLTTELRHEGSQAAFLISGLSKAVSAQEERFHYRNSFSAIPASVQYRPRRKTEKAHFYGTMNARIDAAGSGTYAELDNQGRYKVILPFDLSGRSGGKASAFIRMMQPYAGSNHGFHFPLHKNTEVLLTFIDGDPDRPIIAGAVPNPEHPSLVTADNQTSSRITTSGGNKIHIEDKAETQRILMQSPTQNSWVRIGAVNDPPSAAGGFFSEDGIAISTDKRFAVTAKVANSTVFGENGSFTGGMDNKVVVLERNDMTVGLRFDTKIGGTVTFDTWHKGVKLSEVWAKVKSLFVRGQRQEVAGEHNNVIGEQNNVNGEENNVNGEQNNVNGEENNVNGEQNNVQGEVNNVAGEQNNVQGEVNNVAGEQNNVQGEVNNVAGEQNNVAGEQNNVQGEVNNVAGEQNNVNGEVNNVNGEENVVVGMLNIV